MHSFTALNAKPFSRSNTTFNYNSDLSGDVIINIEGYEFKVPGDHLLQFLAHYVRAERIAALEQADEREVLGI